MFRKLKSVVVFLKMVNYLHVQIKTILESMNETDLPLESVAIYKNKEQTELFNYYSPYGVWCNFV